MLRQLVDLPGLFAARFIDRVGKGIRGAPRDALVADIAPPHLRGASFGLRQSLDTVSAFIGPLLASEGLAAPANFCVPKSGRTPADQTDAAI